MTVQVETEGAGVAPDIRAMVDIVREASSSIRALEAEVRKVIVGQDTMLERIFIALLTGGHILLEGVPGLAKTLAVRSVADAVEGSFSRIQFTPDLLPADLTGTQIFDPKAQEFRAKRGPVFANFVLADEINRAPAKVQSALLEAMQEHQVTLGAETHRLPDPFLVLATQNPIEQEGTYPLPEAQTDRFMLHVKLNYPTKAQERAILDRMSGRPPEKLKPVLTLNEIAKLRNVVRSIHSDDKVRDYMIDIVFATRSSDEPGLRELAALVEMGASPRASLALDRAAKAHAFLRGRPAVFPDDVKAVGPDVLRHRIKLSYEAEAENIQVDELIARIFDNVPIP
jgi:MoxR-like ATPase